MSLRKVILIILMALSIFSFAEGTKELGDFTAFNGGLYFNNQATYSPFGLYNSSEDYQIKIRVADTSEYLFYGMQVRRSNGNLAIGQPYRIKDPSGNVVFIGNSAIAGEAGFINTFAEVQKGPDLAQSVGGYLPRTFKPDTIGDYVIEFDPIFDGANGSYIFRYFDVTVMSSTNNPIKGRLHSKGWQMSSGGYDSPILSKVYPYHPSGVIFEVDLNGMSPYVFSIYFNSHGTDTTGDFNIDRKSKIGRYIFPEFNVFLNPPDESQYPVKDTRITYDATLTQKGCEKSEFCLDFRNSSTGVVDGFIDFNLNSIYEPDLGDLLFTDIIDSTGKTCIEWNGLDANGNQIGKGEIKLVTRLGSGIMHLPLYDIEHNPNGYKVTIHKPAILPDPAIYWDDSLITKGNLLGSPLVELGGCKSTTAQGCHKWIDRGEINGDRNLQETINTWWYSEIEFDTVIFDYIPNNPVNISYLADSLLKDHEIICAGDTVDFYVFNNGDNHYDSSRYNYEWYLNTPGSAPILLDSNNLRIVPLSTSELFLKSVFKINSICTSIDSIIIRVVDPLVVDLDVNDTICVDNIAEARINFTTNQINPVINWAESPTNHTNESLNLITGTYKVQVIDTNINKRCSWDTTFSVVANTKIEIESIVDDSTFCYDTTGDISISMVSKTQAYEYNWESLGFTSDSTHTNLKVGKYAVQVRDSLYGCVLDTIIPVGSMPIVLQSRIDHEECSDSTGLIGLGIPSTALTVSWGDIATQDTLRTNLLSGTYAVSVFSNLTAGCRVDTSFEIVDTLPNLSLLQASFSPTELIKTHKRICENDSVDFHVFEDGQSHYNSSTFDYTWFISRDDSVHSTNVKTINIRPKKNEKVWVEAVYKKNAHCIMKDSLEIEVVAPLKGELEIKDTICVENRAVAILSWTSVQNPVISWLEFPLLKDSINTDLVAGTYSVNLIDTNFTKRCSWDTTFTVKPNAKIEIESIVEDSTFCYDTTGDISISMVNKTQAYEYNWESLGFATDPTLKNLKAGNYAVQVRDSLYGCLLDTIIPVGSMPIQLQSRIDHEECSDSTGLIGLGIPSSALTVSWGDIATQDTLRTNLLSGLYNVSVFSNLTLGCRVDTSFEILDTLPNHSLLQASFSPTALVKTHKRICENDSIDFYVFEDGQSHYNSSVFDYTWFVTTDDNVHSTNTSTIKIRTATNEKVWVEAIYKNNTHCVMLDSLEIETAAPTAGDLSVNDTICIENRAEAIITYNTTQNPVITWLEFPTFTDSIKTDLTEGTYHVSVVDTNFSKRCAWDTSFAVNANTKIEIESIIEDSTFCYESTGDIAIAMVNNSQAYEYNWEILGFVTDPTHTNLKAGNYAVQVRDSLYGCLLDTIIPVGSMPIQLLPRIDHEECSDSTGLIGLGIPSTALTVNWGDIATQDTLRTNLLSGTYAVSVFSNLTAGCRVDTSFEIVDTLPNLSLLQASFSPTALVKTHKRICENDSIDFYVFEDGQSHYNSSTFDYTWFITTDNNMHSTNVNTINIRTATNEKVWVEAIYKSNVHCIMLDSLEIETAAPTTGDLSVKDTICIENRAEAIITYTTTQNPTITWLEFPLFTDSIKTDLVEGTYHVSVIDTNFSKRCAWDTSFAVNANTKIEIESIIKDSTFCYESTGDIAIAMVNKTQAYEYNWEILGFATDPTHTNLKAGNYAVQVRDSLYGCLLDTIIPVGSMPIQLLPRIDHEECSDSTGLIGLGIPSTALTVNWGDIATQDTLRTNLLSGTYSVSVFSNLTASCRVDTSFEILDTLPNLSLLKASFSPTALVKTHKRICENDSIDFYVFEDGQSHYNSSIFDYTWFIATDDNVHSANVNTINIRIATNEKVWVEAIYKSNVHCVMLDSLEIETAAPTIGDLSVNDTICIENRAEAIISYNTTQNPTITWLEFPTFTDSIKTDLTEGTYHVSVIDTNFSSRCAWDTTFAVNANTKIEIESIIDDSTFCYESTGDIAIAMVNKTQAYEYNWESLGFTTDPTHTNLKAGNYAVQVRDSLYGCLLDTVIPVNGLPIKVLSQTMPLTCDDSSAIISLTIPGTASFEVKWNDITTNPLYRRDLLPGSYTVKISSGLTANCRFDSTYVIEDKDRPVSFESLKVTPTNCVVKTGTIDAKIKPFDKNAQYLISWDGGKTFGSKFINNTLAIGTYKVVVMEVGTVCKVDTVIPITAKDHDLSLKTKNALCEANIGFIDMTVTDPNFSISWLDAPQNTSYDRDSLAPGTYTYTLINAKHSECNLTSSIVIGQDINFLQADFEIQGYKNNLAAYTLDTLRFKNTSNVITPIVKWTFSDTTVYRVHNPTHYFQKADHYDVQLYIEDEFGCKSIKDVSLDIQDFQDCKMVMPDAFSPNGDNYNDDIGVLGNANEMELRIYSRWGELIFLSEEQEFRWNGLFLGEQSPVGIYVYLLEFSCNDLKGKYTNLKKIGEITLVR